MQKWNLADAQEVSKAENQKLQEAILTKITRVLEAKLQEIYEPVSRRITGV